MAKLIAIVLIACTAILATDINGRFIVKGTDNGKLEVLLQVNTNTGSDDMGGATIVIGFNNSSLNFSSNPQVNTNYIFHNFSGGNYSPATITKPAIDKLWLNIDLPFNNSNNGTIVSGSSGWTDAATLFFDIINPADTLKINCLMTNFYWGIYDANNITLWSPGTFQNLSYVINSDITPPQLFTATLSNSTTIILNFSEQLDSSTAQNINNYSITNGIGISNAELSITQVTLKTSSEISGTYTVTVNNVTDIAGNIIDPNHNSVSNHLLPVELNSFTAVVKDNQVILKWITETEINNYGFEVERCALSAERQAWNKIGFVAGNGNSNSQKEYVFNDENPTGGSKYQYRLKQIDNDGQFEYSKILEVNIIPDEYSLFQNYPNPFNPSTEIYFTLTKSGNVSLKVFNSLGSVVAALIDGFMESGKHSIKYITKDSSSGIYFYKLKADNFTSTRKMLLIK